MSWVQIVRLGLVQACIGAVVVLMTATMNRVMVVELGLPASVPGALVALHFAIQLYLRPRLGHGSDATGSRTPWIIGGMATLAAGGIGVALAMPLIQTSAWLGIALAAVSFVVLGAGVSAAGTPLLAIISEYARPTQRAGAAAITWILMIVGFIITTASAGRLLDPFGFERLFAITAGVGAVAVLVTCATLFGLEARLRTLAPAPVAVPAAERQTQFRDALRNVWQEPVARTFAVFILVAMLAYSAQDLILEPFGGIAFGLSAGETTKIAGMQHGGVLVGMIATALIGSRLGSLRLWAAAGCAASAVMFVALAVSPVLESVSLYRTVVFLLGLANGVFAIGAIGSMMALTGDAKDGRAGLRLGVFGAAQAVAYAAGVSIGGVGVDVARALLGSPVRGYAAVFSVEAALFLVSAVLAYRSASDAVAGDVMRTRGEMLAAVVNN
ncbi:MAG: BCD family MFS transporter [Gemmatimonadaceae bacterium]|nr:BCD family MFS transporter [Gemmatimonadaceae bacterium]